MGFIKTIIVMLKYLLRDDIKIYLSTKLNRKTVLKGFNRIGRNTDICGSYVDKASYVGDDCKLVRTKIGKFCAIAPNVRVRVGKHPTNTFVSIHPAFYSTRKQALFTFVKEDKYVEFKNAKDGFSVEIGNDVWIGSDVIILEGVHIGDGAIVGAGSLVTKDIEPYSINLGSPTTIVKYRFEKEEISKLLKLKWWDKDWAWLKEHADQFDSIKNIAKFD